MISRQSIISLMAAIGLLAGTSSCVNEPLMECPVDVDQVQQPAEKLVNLALSVAAPAPAGSVTSRAQDGTLITTPDKDNYFEKETDRYELIHTLRVIIVRPNRVVEHNKQFILSDEGVVQYDDMTFLVAGGEEKKIYIIANEASIPDANLDQIIGVYNNQIENINLSAGANGVLIDNTGDTKTWIPMSGVYTQFVSIPEHPGDNYQTVDQPIYLTRAAVKFQFSVAAVNGGMPLDLFEKYYVTGFRFNRIANQEYLLPRGIKTADGTNGNDTPYPDLAGQFITDFNIPAGTAHSPLIMPGNTELDIPRDKDKPITWSNPIYYCESKYNPGTTNPYSLYMTVQAKDDEGNWIEGSEYEFGPARLPNLPILPRNTIVKLNIVIWKYDMQATVTLVPYVGVTLNPWFGF